MPYNNESYKNVSEKFKSRLSDCKNQGGDAPRLDFRAAAALKHTIGRFFGVPAGGARGRACSCSSVRHNPTGGSNGPGGCSLGAFLPRCGTQGGVPPPRIKVRCFE